MLAGSAVNRMSVLWHAPAATDRRRAGIIPSAQPLAHILPSSLALTPGTRLGPYEVTAQIGVDNRSGGRYMRGPWWYLVLAVVVGACSDAGERSTVVPAGSDVDACVLVDASDAAIVLGSTTIVDTTPAAGFGQTSSCWWITESEALLSVSVFEGREFYGGGGVPGAEVLEVGDQGYITVEPNFGGVELQVVKGEWVLSLATTPFGVVDVEGLPAAMTIVAQQAIDRLP